MSNAAVLLSIAEVIELPPGDEQNPTWVNGEIKALVAAITPKTSQKGKPFWAIVFADETTNRMQVETTIFTAPKFSVGDLIIIAGSGIRRTQYKDKAQIALSAKSEIHVLGRAVAAQTQAAPAPQRSAAPAPYISGDVPAVGSFVPHGASVGIAVKEALALTVDEGTAVGSPDFWKRVYRHSSDILRLMHTLESGRLAPSLAVRTPNAPATAAETPSPAEALPERSTPPRAATRPQPGPDSSVKHNPTDDEDVPF